MGLLNRPESYAVPLYTLEKKVRLIGCNNLRKKKQNTAESVHCVGNCALILRLKPSFNVI